MIKTILNEPICNCVLKIQNKYTQIRNNAMETDQNNQPEKHWFSVDYKNYEKACNENGAIYLNELLLIEHNCTQNETIKQFLEHDRMYWNVQFTTLGSNAVSDIEKSIEKYDEQRIRCLDELKKATSGLNEIPDADYWIYFNSLQHLQLNRELLENFKNKTPQQNEKPKPEQETPKTFDELFYNTDLVKPCIDILKEIDPPLIDTDYNYIGKLKGIVCVWIDELQRQGIVKHYSDRKIFASLIPQKIKRFSIDESMFGKYQSKAEKNYRTDIKTMVSKIKLSQNSH